MITWQFLTAGSAVFTVSNPTGESYTFKVSRPKDYNPASPIFFVSLLTGPDNQNDYTYAGILLPPVLLKTDDEGDYAKFLPPTIKLTKASKFTPDSKPVKVARWIVRQVWEGKELPAGYACQHCGRCSVCSRLLTDATSISVGIGPTCRARLGIN